MPAEECVISLRSPDQVLIFLMSGLGDVLMFTPALRLLRQAWPKSHLIALTMRTSERDVLECNPDVNELRYWPFLSASFPESMRYLGGLRNKRLDVSILPCPTNRVHYNLISFVCGAQNRAGFRYLHQSWRNLDWLNTILQPHQDDIHNVEHNLRLVESLTGVSRTSMAGWDSRMCLPTLSSDQEQAKAFLVQHQLEEAPCVGLHLSSSRAKKMNWKCWPKERFLELLQALSFKRPDLRFILFCGDEDLPESRWLMDHALGSLQLSMACKMPIRIAAEVIRSCILFVANDSGLQHVATTMGTPSLVIFGPTNPKRTGPWMNTGEVVRTGIPCSPCFYHTSHDLTCPAGTNFACLRDLKMEMVLDAAIRLLRR